MRKISVFAVVLLLLCIPLQGLTFPVENKKVVTCDPASGWTCDLEVTGHWYLSSTIALTNCCYPATKQVAPYGAAFVDNFGGWQSHSSPFSMHDVGPTAAGLVTVARHGAWAVELPAYDSYDILEFGGERRAGPVRVGTQNEALVLAINDGSLNSTITITLYDEKNVKLSSRLMTVPAKSFVYEPIDEFFEGSVRFEAGWGQVSPAVPSLGETFLYVVTGRRSDYRRRVIQPTRTSTSTDWMP